MDAPCTLKLSRLEDGLNVVDKDAGTLSVNIVHGSFAQYSLPEAGHSSAVIARTKRFEIFKAGDFYSVSYLSSSGVPIDELGLPVESDELSGRRIVDGI